MSLRGSRVILAFSADMGPYSLATAVQNPPYIDSKYEVGLDLHGAAPSPRCTMLRRLGEVEHNRNKDAKAGKGDP
jgi:hypothetical protein